MVGVEPVEHAGHALGAALLAARPRLFGREAAVIVGVEPRERLVGALDHLRAGDVGVAVGAVGARPGGLRDRGAGHGQQGGACQETQLVHRDIPPVHSKIHASFCGPPVAQLCRRPEKMSPIVATGRPSDGPVAGATRTY